MYILKYNIIFIKAWFDKLGAVIVLHMNDLRAIYK